MKLLCHFSTNQNVSVLYNLKTYFMSETPNRHKSGSQEIPDPNKNQGNERIPQNEEEADVESTQSISLEQQELFKGKKVDEDIESEDDLPMEQRDL
jgi:hypothetical protein